MNTDQKAGAGAYKSGSPELTVVETGTTEQRRDQARPPFHLNLTKDRQVSLDYRQAAIAAGALGLGYLAFKGVSRAMGQGIKKKAEAAGHTGRLEPVPLADSVRPEVKDNAAPRFVGEPPNRIDEPAPFVAASSVNDTAGLTVDRSNETAEHVPTDLMADRDPARQDRAIDAFRPDPTAPVPEGMRESLRPATGPATGFAADRGTFGQGLSQTDGSK